MTGCSLPTPVLKTVHSSNPWGWHWGERGFLLFTCKYKMSIMSNILQLAFYLKHLLLLKNQMFTWNKKLDLSAINGHLKVTTEIWCKSGMSILHFNCHLKCHSHRILQARTHSSILAWRIPWTEEPDCSLWGRKSWTWLSNQTTTTKMPIRIQKILLPITKRGLISVNNKHIHQGSLSILVIYI